ncbi:MAG: glycosyl hydrolase 53 family protein [Clostridia bacterium]|nr:glycosyl hydrolase 53 family protein [Clostridia bacterium]
MRKRIISAAVAAVTAAVSCGIVSADGGAAVNLIKNGDFDGVTLTEIGDWKFKTYDKWISGGSIVEDGGNHYASVNGTGIGQNVAVTQGTPYRLTAKVKTTGSVKLCLQNGDAEYPGDLSSATLASADVTNSDWDTVTVDFNGSVSTNHLFVYVWSDSGVTTCIDDVSLEEYEMTSGIANSKFDDGITGWSETGDGTAVVNDGVLTITNPAEGDTVNQTVTNLEDGKYNLTALAKTTNIEGEAYIYAKTDDHTTATAAIPQTAAMGTVVVPNVTVVDGRCEIGVYAKGSATVTVDNFTLTPSESTRVEFLKGGEISKLTYVESQGGKFYRADGTEGDALQIMAENGFNLARIRLLDDPGKGHGDGTYYLPEYFMTEKDCLQLARRAKEKGMQILFSFAYSDYWVDGEKQIIPHRWQEEITAKKLSGEAKYAYLENKTYEYTKDVMQKLIEQGTRPEYVSIGNEIQVGLFFGNQKDKTCMWDSAMYNNADMLARFLNAGARAVREVSPETKIILHSDNGGKLSGRNTFKSALSKVGNNYDVIGVSYYPYYNADVSIDKVVSEFNSLISTYNKDVIVMETGYNWNEYKKGGPWDGQLKDSGYYQNIYGESQEGQRAFLTELYAKLKQVSGGRCIGDCYWDPVMIHDDAYKIGWAQRESDDYSDGNVVPNSTIFDFDGKAVEGQKAMKYNTNSSDTLLISGTVKNGGRPVTDKTLTFTVGGEKYNTVSDKFGDYIVSVPFKDGDIELTLNGSVKTVTPNGRFIVTGVDFDTYTGADTNGIRLKGMHDGGKISYNADYTVPRGKEGEVMLWAALYDNEGRLIEVKRGRSGTFEHMANGGRFNIRAFLWQNSGEPAYATDSAEIDDGNE